MLTQFFGTVPSEQRALLIAHLTRLLQRDDLQGCVIVLGVESNLGFEADHHEGYIIDENLHDRVCVVHESTRSGRSEKSVGLQATNARKETMAHLVQYDLQQKRFRIADEVTCVGSTAEKVLKEMYEQLIVFCRMVEPAPRIGGKPRIIYTGKHARSQDDLSMAFQWNKMADMYFNNPQGRIAYADYHALAAAA